MELRLVSFVIAVTALHIGQCEDNNILVSELTPNEESENCSDEPTTGGNTSI